MTGRRCLSHVGNNCTSLILFLRVFVASPFPRDRLTPHDEKNVSFGCFQSYIDGSPISTPRSSSPQCHLPDRITLTLPKRCGNDTVGATYLHLHTIIFCCVHDSVTIHYPRDTISVPLLLPHVLPRICRATIVYIYIQLTFNFLLLVAPKWPLPMATMAGPLPTTGRLKDPTSQLYGA